MITISIAKDFSRIPGARFPEEGTILVKNLEKIFFSQSLKKHLLFIQH